MHWCAHWASACGLYASVANVPAMGVKERIHFGQMHFGSGWPKAIAIIDDIRARAVFCDEPFEPLIDKLRDQPNQRRAHVANRHEQRRTGHVRNPQIVPRERRYTARNVEPAFPQRLAVFPVQRKDLVSLIRRFDLPKLAR